MATAEAAQASLGPRYAPDDPTLPKPWKGLIDGSTGTMYYWNPKTYITQFEKPVTSFTPPLPPGQPPSVMATTAQSNGISQQLGQQQQQQVSTDPNQQNQLMTQQQQGMQMSLGAQLQTTQMAHRGQQQGPQYNTKGMQQQEQLRQQMLQQPVQRMQQTGQQTPQHQSQQMQHQQHGQQFQPQLPQQMYYQQPGQQIPQSQSQGQHIAYRQSQQYPPQQGQQYPPQQGQQYPPQQSQQFQPQQSQQFAPQQSQQFAPQQNQQFTPLQSQQFRSQQSQQFPSQQSQHMGFQPRDETEFQPAKPSGFSAPQIQQTGSSHHNLPTGTQSGQAPKMGSQAMQQQQFGSSSANAPQTGIDQNIDMGSRCGEDAAKNVVVENSPGQVQSGDVGNTDQNIDMTSQCGEDAAKNVVVEKSPRQVKSGDAGKTDHNIDMASRCDEDAAKNVAVEKSSGQVQFGVVGKIDQNIDMGSRCGEDAAKNVVVENSPGQVQSGDVGNTDQNIDMTSQCGEDAAKNVVVEKSPRQVKSGDAGKTDHNIDMASRCDEDAAKNVAVEKSPGQVQSGEAGMTVESIDMASRCGEDAAKNFGIEKSPEQAQHHAGNQSSPSKLGSPGQRQSHQVESSDQIIDMAVTPSGNAAKTVVSKKSPSFRNSRKVDYQSTPDKVNSVSYIINSCKTQREMQLTSEGDTNSIITREKRKKMQATPANVTNSIITREERKKMQSTPENVTDGIITREKRKKMQSTPENDTVPSRTKLKAAEVVKTPLAPCHARTTRVLTETDWMLDFATQTTKGQGDNVGGKSSSESTEVKRAESPILTEMFLNCSKEGYKDHTKDLNSGQEQLKHVLESNGSRNQSSVEGSSHLPQNIIDVEQYEVVNQPKTQVPGRPMKLRIRPTRQKGEPLAHDDIKQETTKGGSKQTSNVSDRKRKAKVSISKALVKDVEHSGTVGIQAPVLASTDVQSKGGDHNAAGESSQAIETQTKGLEQTTPSKEIINFVVQREDATKETDMDWALSDIGDLHQPPIHHLKDSPIRGSEVQNSLDIDVSSFSFGGTTANTLLDQAIGDEVSESERIHQPFLICSSADQMLQEDESFPFIKCSLVWETVESLEVFRVMPQRLHFRPLAQFDMYLREGLAIGSMVNFANIVEEVGKAKLDDPPSILQKWSKALENFKAYGFNVQPIQARLETLRRIKDEQAKLNEELMEAEGQISVILAEKISVEAELDEQNKKIRELQEYLNQLIKKREQTILKKEVQDSSIAELKKSIDNATECIHSVTSEFRTVVATPW